MKVLGTKKILLFFLLHLTVAFVFAQEGQHHSTIKVQKKGHLLKAHYDNVNYRLVGIDHYGNIMDTAIIEYQVSVTIRGIFYSEKVNGAYLSNNMVQAIEQCDRATKIVFDKVKARDRDGTIVDMPKFQYMLGNFNEDFEY